MSERFSSRGVRLDCERREENRVKRKEKKKKRESKRKKGRKRKRSDPFYFLRAPLYKVEVDSGTRGRRAITLGRAISNRLLLYMPPGENNIEITGLHVVVIAVGVVVVAAATTAAAAAASRPARNRNRQLGQSMPNV